MFSQLGVPHLIGFRVEFYPGSEEVQLAHGKFIIRQLDGQLILLKIPYFLSRYLALGVIIAM